MLTRYDADRSGFIDLAELAAIVADLTAGKGSAELRGDSAADTSIRISEPEALGGEVAPVNAGGETAAVIVGGASASPIGPTSPSNGEYAR